MNSKVVVIGQNYSTCYGIIRALGEAGYRCEVGKRIHDTPKGFLTPELKSKYVDKFAYLKTRDDAVMVQDIISYFAVKGEKRHLMPADDFCAALIDRNLQTLQEYFYLPSVNGVPGEVSKLMDKLYQKDIAKKYDVKTADICVIDRKENIDSFIPQDLPYPCFIKPLSSAGNPKHLMRKCNSYEELVSGLTEAFNERDCKMLVERYIDIEKEYTIPGIAVDGRVIIPSILEKTKVGAGGHKGVTITGKVLSAAPFDDIVMKLKRIIKNIGLTGIFDIEILVSNGEYYFNELNLRYGAAGYALTGSGVNLPALYVESMQNGVAVFKDEYKFKQGKTFVNEKAAFENYLAGHGKFNDFIKSIWRADIRFLISFSDIKVSFYFFKMVMRLTIRKKKSGQNR